MISGNKESQNENGGYPVLIDGEVLDQRPSQNLRNHSPNGFAWGFSGSGPSQLALALLLHFSNPETALRLYQEFKTAFIADLPDDFFLKKDKVRDWLMERVTPEEARYIRKPETEAFCDLHLCKKWNLGEKLKYECGYCLDDEPEYEELCSNCREGIHVGAGRYRLGELAYCEACGTVKGSKYGKFLLGDDYPENKDFFFN